MKKAQKLFLTTVLLFVFLFLLSNFIFGMIITHNNDSANIYMNRFFYALQERISDEDPVQIGALIEKLRAEQGSLVIKAILVLRENLTAEQADKASELFSGRGMMRPGGMGAGGERHRSRRNGGEGRRGSSAPADKPAADK